MEIRIEPLDTLFFRDGKPFTMGEDSWADSNMLPSPSVIYGALRTAVATENGISFEEVEKQLNKDNFSVESIYFYTDQNRLPMPLDFVELEGNANRNEKNQEWLVHALTLMPKNKLVYKDKAYPITHFLKPIAQADIIEDGLITTADFEEYLQGYLEETKVKRIGKNYIKNEPKIGIALDDFSKTSQESSLFRTDMKRYHYLNERENGNFMQNSLQIGIRLKTDLAFNSLVRFGGEGKIIQLLDFTNNNLSFKVNTEDIEFEDGLFKVYLATPAIFINGLPNLLKKLKIKATLLTACIGKPLNIGGYDLSKNEPKKMYKAVPAGSVFYFKSEDDLSLLHQNQGIALSDVYPEQGFGIAYFGAYHI